MKKVKFTLRQKLDIVEQQLSAAHIALDSLRSAYASEIKRANAAEFINNKLLDIMLYGAKEGKFPRV